MRVFSRLSARSVELIQQGGIMNRYEASVEEIQAESNDCPERQELETVLTTVLNRSSNMKKLLSYVCKRYFDGQASEIKEYSIAVDAFGRPAGFDPATDSIIRVEAHRLRHKLALYYRQKGAHHRVQIVLPAGGYVPQFIHQTGGMVTVHADEKLAQSPHSDRPSSGLAVSPIELEALDFPDRTTGGGRGHAARWLIGAAMVVVCLFAVAFAVSRFTRRGTQASLEQDVGAIVHPASKSNALAVPVSSASSEVRIMSGASFSTMTDESGEIWLGDRYFSGGGAEAIAPKAFEFTTTPSIYFRRRRGNFSYAIPLRKGIYELKLYFADAFFGQGNPEEGGESSRLFDVKANGKTLLSNFDVVADAGGSNTADIKVFRSIQPAADGFLHLDFIPSRNVAFVNAIEVLPAPSHKMLPIHIYAGTSDYEDNAGIFWNSDRYFRGGVHRQRADERAAGADLSGFIDERFGNFVYGIPVAEDGVYTAKLRFCQGNILNSQPFKTESNLFNVYLNGKTLLENFEIAAGAQAPVCTVKAFSGIKPSAQGKLIFSFVPVRGYASLNSIEIDEE